MLRRKITRRSASVGVVLSALATLSSLYVAANAADHSFNDTSSLAPSIPAADGDFTARVISRALRPTFIRPQEEADQSSFPVRNAAPQGGWRPRMSALSSRAAARFDGQSASLLPAHKSDGAGQVASPAQEPELAEPLAAAPQFVEADQSTASNALRDATSGPSLGLSPDADEPEPAEPLLADEPVLDNEPALAEADENEAAEEAAVAPPTSDEQLEGLSGDELDEALAAREQAKAAVEEETRQQTAQSKPKSQPAAVKKPSYVAEAGAEPDGIVAVPSQKLAPLSRSQQALRDKVRRVLKHYYDHPLHTGNRGPWEVMHQMLAFEVHSRIRQGGPTGQPITAVGWLCFNMPCRERNLLYLNNDGELRVRVGPALQGHQGQLLALLAQARVKSSYPIRVEGKELTIADLVEAEKLTCYPKTELTFKLLGLQAYLPIDSTWVNDQGMSWDFATLVREEMQQPVRTAACGGTHRLSGLTFAYKKYQKAGKPLTGEFAAAKRFVANYQNYAYRLQNSDGSFSTEWFRGPGSEPDLDRRLKTTGHQLEWLLYVAEEKQFTYPRTVKAVNYLANIMWNNRGRDWEAGPLGHAIHALVLYDRLYLQKYDAAGQDAVATGPAKNRR